mgnify:FL=1
MRRTKIVCTMGPNTNSRDLMKKLIETGMDVARFNFLMETTMSRKCVWIC